MGNKPETKKLTFAEMTTLAADEFFKLCKAVAAPFEKLDKAKATIADEIKQSGKICAAAKRRYQADYNAGDKIPKDMPFKRGPKGKRPGYWDMHVGGELPGRVEQLAELFNALVLGAGGAPIITEEDYDLCASAWLEKANPIINGAIDAHGDNWRTSPDVLEVQKILTKRPENGLKLLGALRKRQKGEADAAVEAGEGAEGAETAPAAPANSVVLLTVGHAVEFLKAAITGAQDDQNGYDLFCAVMEIGDTMAAHPQSNAWATRLQTEAEAAQAAAAEAAKGATPAIKSLADLPQLPTEAAPAAAAA